MSAAARMLGDLLADAAARAPEAVAISDASGATSYRALDELANRIAHALAGRGVVPGERVALWCPKSAAVVAAMQAALRLGAPYVPLDPLSPPPRIASVIADAQPRIIVTTPERAARLRSELTDARFLLVDGPADDPAAADRRALAALPTTPPLSPRDPGATAYLLYTSGSTGRPKGVCLSHANALAFVDWAVAAIGVTGDDVLASHAPLHFDLSVFDLYAAFAAGARVVLVPESAANLPPGLVRLLQRERISVWYSVPSALQRMMDAGLLDAPDLALRAILFAGEVFPIASLRRLRARFSGARLFNLYGPTETNVCTAYELRGPIPDARHEPLPIGAAVAGDEVWAQRDDGGRAAPGEEGELWVSGPTVMQGYFGAPAQRGPYNTGDLVRVLDEGGFQFVGRRDDRVKLRGVRVELGDLEAVLADHPDVAEAAAVVIGQGEAARLVVVAASRSGQPIPLLDMKRHTAARLPRALVVDQLVHVTALPRTSTGKVDRPHLRRALAAAPTGRG